MNKLFLIGILWLTTLTCSGQTEIKKEMDYKDEKFEVGQVWTYETRTGEENSTIQILKIDKYENQEAFIHVSVEGLKLKNPKIESGVSEDIGHLPFSRKSLNESVTKLVSNKEELSDYKDGYNAWKEAFEKEKAGVFSISISEAVEFVESTLNQ